MYNTNYNKHYNISTKNATIHFQVIIAIYVSKLICDNHRNVPHTVWETFLTFLQQKIQTETCKHILAHINSHDKVILLI